MKRADTEGPTVKLLKSQGWDVCKASSNNGRISQDLFGCVDVVAVKGRQTLGVQSTSRGHVSDRVKKCREKLAELPHVSRNWRIEVWGWKTENKKTVGDEPARVEIVLDNQ